MKKQLRAALALNLKSLLFVSLLMGAVSGVRADDYELYTGELTAGDYLVVYNSKAMKAAISNSRLSYTEVTITNNVITNPAANLVWTITADGKYFTLYNSSVAKYAASTGAANKARLDASTSDNARWTVTGNTTYEFVNYANDKGGVNKNLRNNGTYGFACYSTSTGGALSLYKLNWRRKYVLHLQDRYHHSCRWSCHLLYAGRQRSHDVFHKIHTALRDNEYHDRQGHCRGRGEGSKCSCGGDF